jgi:hypothetical protein
MWFLDSRSFVAGANNPEPTDPATREVWVDHSVPAYIDAETDKMARLVRARGYAADSSGAKSRQLSSLCIFP